MKSVVVGTAGHIDHGKSTLVRALTGIDPDRLKEEKARGITIDLGFAHAVIDDTNVAFVDVPGHERFVKNMLAGVGGIDLVLLVVAATEGVMPQTREHFDICRLLQIPYGIVALTKTDQVDSDGLEVARADVRDLIAGSFLEDAPIVPVSAETGDGLEALRAALVRAAATVRRAAAAGGARLPIDRVFSVKGFGTVVTGTLVSGTIRSGDLLEIRPNGRPVTIRGVQVHGARRDYADGGERTALNVAGAEVEEIARGLSLATPGTLTDTDVVDAAVEMLPGAPPLRHGARVRFHQGTAEIIGRVSLIAVPSPGGPPTTIESGGRGYARVRLEREASLTRSDRFILRAYSPPVTVAGGTVLDPAPPPRSATRTAAAVARFRRLDGDGVMPIAAMIDDAGVAGLRVGALTTRAGVAADGAAAVIDGLAREGRAMLVGDLLIAMPVFERVQLRLRTALTDHHRAHPMSEGMPREEARERVFGRGDAGVFERVLHDLTAAGVIAGRDRLRLSGHKLDLSPEEGRARTAIEEMLKRAGLTPPLGSALASDAGVAPAVADRVVRALQHEKRVVKVHDFWFHADVLAALKEHVMSMKKEAVGKAATLDVSTFKTRFGVSRKFAIPLLEYLDRERITRRMGESRAIL